MEMKLTYTEAGDYLLPNLIKITKELTNVDY